MGSPFKGERTKSKIQVAQHSLLALLRLLYFVYLTFSNFYVLIDNSNQKTPLGLYFSIMILLWCNNSSHGKVQCARELLYQSNLPFVDIDSVDLEKQILQLRATGGTEISKAMKAAKEMYTTTEMERYVLLLFFGNFIFQHYFRTGYSNRIFFLTDMEVSSSDAATFKDSILQNSNGNLWSTVVGIGLDLTQVFCY